MFAVAAAAAAAAIDAVAATMSSFTDRIDPFSKTSKKKPRKSQGSSRFRTKNEVELQSLPLLKGNDDPRISMRGSVSQSVGLSVNLS